MVLDKLRGMAIFASVVRHGSFNGAAKELGITTSAVSQQVRALEESLGVLLLQRSTRKLNLTEAGNHLFESAHQIITSAEEGHHRVSQLRHDISGSLRIATLPQIAYNYLLPALSGWFDEHQDLSWNFVTSSCKTNIHEDHIDLLVSFTTKPNSDDVVLTEAKQMILASPQHITEPLTKPEDILKYNFITCGLIDTMELSNADDNVNIKVNSKVSSDNADLALNLAMTGYGLVRSNTLEAQNAIRAGLLSPVLTNYNLPTTYLVAQSNSKSQPTKVARCIEILQAYFKATPIV